MTRVTVEIEQPDSQAETLRRELGIAPSILISVEEVNERGGVQEIKVVSFGMVADTQDAARILRELADGITEELEGGRTI